MKTLGLNANPKVVDDIHVRPLTHGNGLLIVMSPTHTPPGEVLWTQKSSKNDGEGVSPMQGEKKGGYVVPGSWPLPPMRSGARGPEGSAAASG